MQDIAEQQLTMTPAPPVARDVRAPWLFWTSAAYKKAVTRHRRGMAHTRDPRTETFIAPDGNEFMLKADGCGFPSDRTARYRGKASA